MCVIGDSILYILLHVCCWVPDLLLICNYEIVYSQFKIVILQNKPLLADYESTFIIARDLQVK